MYETQQAQQPHEEHPGVYEAAQRHWEALATPSGLRAEFASNYLGCWPNSLAFVSELASCSGRDCPADADGFVARLEQSEELAFVPDKNGVHVFVHPIGPKPMRRPSGERTQRLHLVPPFNDGESEPPRG